MWNSPDPAPALLPMIWITLTGMLSWMWVSFFSSSSACVQARAAGSSGGSCSCLTRWLKFHAQLFPDWFHAQRCGLPVAASHGWSCQVRVRVGFAFVNRQTQGGAHP